MIVEGTGYPPELLVGVTSARLRGLSPPARDLHKAVLSTFAVTGRAPNPTSLPAPGGHDRQAFFTSPTNANAWLDEHPTVSGVVLTKKQALQLGVDIFGAVLDD